MSPGPLSQQNARNTDHDAGEAKTIRLTKQGWDDFLDILDRPDSEALTKLREYHPNWH